MSAVGFFGKIPSEGDYFRGGAHDPATNAFERFLTSGQERLSAARAALPVQPARFVFQNGAGDTSLVGAFAPSRDRVGRQFPLAVFAAVPSDVLRSSVSSVHIACDAFFQAVGGLLSVPTEQHTVASLREAMGHLPQPMPLQFQEASRVGQRVLENGSVAELHQRLFVDIQDGRHLYAYHTLLTAARAAKSGATSTTLDCPVQVDLDLFIWLELSRVLLGHATFSFFWLEDPMPRLLIPLGEPTGALLPFLGNARLESQNLWPLTTHRDAAIRAAAQGFQGRLDAFGPGSGAVLGELVGALASTS